MQQLELTFARRLSHHVWCVDQQESHYPALCSALHFPHRSQRLNVFRDQPDSAFNRVVCVEQAW